jgi:hypothetical protein
MEIVNAVVKEVYFACIVTQCGRLIYCSPSICDEVEIGYTYQFWIADGFCDRYVTVLKLAFCGV